MSFLRQPESRANRRGAICESTPSCAMIANASRTCAAGHRPSSRGGATAAPSITITYSPRGACVCARVSAAARPPCQISSCSLVNSRARVTRRSPNTATRSPRLSSRRWGVSKQTSAPGSSAVWRSSCWRSLRWRGKKPRNRKRAAQKPDTASAVTTAEGPGTGASRCPAAMAACTSSHPGSAMPGIPASETSATSPVSRAARTSAWRCAFLGAKASV